MLTIFTVPKSFKGHINTIQRNAIQSWLQFRPRCQIILFGNEEGTEKVAAEFGLLHVPDVACNEFGSFLINAVFDKVVKMADYQKLAYVSADIIFLSDFTKAVEKINKDPFLMVGRRWDTDIKEAIQFDKPGWEQELRSRVAKGGKLHDVSATDYPVFSQSFLKIIDLPPFIVGRPGADNWFIYRCRTFGIPVIDATEVVTAIHQNHDYSHHPQGMKGVMQGEEARRNLKLGGGFSKVCTLRDADWILTPRGLEKPKFPRCLFNKLSLFYPWRLLLALRRKIKNFLE